MHNLWMFTVLLMAASPACAQHQAVSTEPLPTSEFEAPTDEPEKRSISTDIRSLSVELSVKKKLRLVQYIVEGEVIDEGLQGMLVAEVSNPTDQGVLIQNLENHGLIFTNKETGERHVVIHTCKCMMQHTDTRQRMIVPPGKTQITLMDGWGCGGGEWTPPPKGQYHVRYHLVPASPPYVKGREQCRSQLLGDTFWKRDVVSPALDITL